MNIIEFRDGMSVEGKDFLVEGREVKQTKNGSDFLKLSLMDKTGSISANIWGYSEVDHGWIKEGVAINLDGSIETYNNAIQFKVANFRPSTKPPSEFAQSTKHGIETMWNYLVEVVSKFQEPLTKFVAEELLIDQANVSELFKKAPAARKVHSAYYGGLLEHVWSMMQIASFVVDHYSKNFISTISRDKVFFGVLLHDLGKMIEYDFSTPAFKYSPRGQLTDHLFMGTAWVWETSNRYPNKDQIKNFRMEQAQLMHLIASHHGKPEWGGPKPATIEGVILHALDKIDSSVMHAVSLINGKRGSIEGFSDKSYVEGVCYLQPNVLNVE